MKDIIYRISELNPYVYGQGDYFRLLRVKLKKKQKELSTILKLDLSCIVDGEGNKKGIALNHFIAFGDLLGVSKEQVLYNLRYAKMRFLGSSLFFCLDDYEKILFDNALITRKQFEIDIWKTDFRVIISDKMIARIKENINKLGGPYYMYKTTSITPTIYYRFCAKKGIGVKSYYNIIRFLGINLLEAENEVLRVTYFGCNKEYLFLREITPLIFRVACHIIGDGSNASRNTFRWIQKINNSGNMIKLIQAITNTNPKTIKQKGGDCNYVTIDAYFSKLLKYGMNIDLKKIKMAATINGFLNLPKDYLIQFLAAIIVDEGCIRWENAKSLVISQSKEDFLIALVNILDYLGYEHSQIKKEVSKSSITKDGSYTIYRVNIYAEGTLKFYNDLRTAISRYGAFAGLWHKQDSLESYINTLKPKIMVKNHDLEDGKNLLGIAVVNIYH